MQILRLMASIKIILDKRSVKKDGTSPLKLRIVYNRKTNHIPLGYSIPILRQEKKNNIRDLA